MMKLWKAAGAAAWGAASYSGLLPMLSPSARAAIEALCPNPGGVYVAAFPYYPGAKSGNLALYCRGEDYHRVLARRLQIVCDGLTALHPGHRFVPGADNSPIPERQVALLAGVGTRGWHNQLIVPRYGSYVFLGTVLTDLPLETTSREEKPSCNGCGACQKACPTKALSRAFFPDRCLAHITQKKGDLSPDESRLVENHPLIWGCDLCQLACPLNRDVPLSPLPEFRKDLLCSLSESDLEGLSNRGFQARYGDKAFAWRGPGPLRRNLMLQKSGEA